MLETSRATLKMETTQFLTGQNYGMPSENPNLSNNVNVHGEKVKTMNTLIVQKQPVSIKEKLLLWSMSSEETRKVVKCFSTAMLTGCSVVALPEVGFSVLGVSLGIFSLGVGSYTLGLFQEIKLLQAVALQRANNLLIQQEVASNVVGENASILSLELAETKNRQLRSDLFRQFMGGVEAETPSAIEVLSSDDDVKSDQRRAKLTRPKIELLQDGSFKVELEEIPRHINDVMNLETTYKNRLNKKYSQTDAEALARIRHIIAEYAKAKNALPANENEIGASTIMYNRNGKVVGITGEEQSVKTFAHQWNEAKRQKKAVPQAKDHNVEMFDIVNMTGLDIDIDSLAKLS